MSELKNCPFCGRKAYKREAHAKVYCDCGVQKPSIEEWNTRQVERAEVDVEKLNQILIDNGVSGSMVVADFRQIRKDIIAAIKLAIEEGRV